MISAFFINRPVLANVLAIVIVLIGGVLAVVGGFQAASSVVPGFPTLGELIVPAILVGLGVVVLSRAIRGR